MNRLRSWIRVVLPRDTPVAAAATLYAATEAAYALWGPESGGIGTVSPWRAAVGEFFKVFHRLAGMLLVLAAAAYGAYRIRAFHPLFRPRYRRWLETTPWTLTDEPESLPRRG